MSEEIKEKKRGYVSKWENRQKRWQLKERLERGAQIKQDEDELGTLDRLKEKENDRRRTSERDQEPQSEYNGGGDIHENPGEDSLLQSRHDAAAD